MSAWIVDLISTICPRIRGSEDPCALRRHEIDDPLTDSGNEILLRIELRYEPRSRWMPPNESRGAPLAGELPRSTTNSAIVVDIRTNAES
jgi:hypothetical protein